MEAFIEERVQRFVLGSRQPVWNELLQHAESTGGNGYLCLTGVAGSGKSALLGKFCQDCRAAQPQDLVIPHFVGASPGSTDVRRTLRRLCHELVTDAGLRVEIPEDPAKLRMAFAEILRQVSTQKRVVIFLDAINQFDPTTQLAGWSWLPEELPATARIILSTQVGPALESLRQWPQPPRPVELQPLDVHDREAIIQEFLYRYRKSMTGDQRAALLAKADAGTPLYLLVALEELRTLGTYEEITDRIAQLPPDTQALSIWILMRFEDDDGFRDASGRKIGQELVSRFVSLLGASRHGLSLQELVELLSPGDPQGNVAALAQLLRPYLMQRGELLDFYHGLFRVAVEQKYLHSEAQRHSAHFRLAALFNQAERTGRPWREASRRSLTEFPYHLWQSGSVEPLYLLARNSNFLDAQRHTVSDDPDLLFLTLQYALNAACVAQHYSIAGEFTVEHARRMDARRAETPLDALLNPGMTSELALSRAWALAESLPLTWRTYWLIVVTWKLTSLSRTGEAQATIKRLDTDPGDALNGLSFLVERLWFLTGAAGGPAFPKWFPYQLGQEGKGHRRHLYIDRWRSGLVAGIIVPGVKPDEIDTWSAARRTVAVVHKLTRHSDSLVWPSVVSACWELNSQEARAAALIAVGFLQAMYGNPHVDTYEVVEKLTGSMTAASKEVVASSLSRFRSMIEQKNGSLSDVSTLVSVLISDVTDVVLTHCILASGMAPFVGQLCLSLVDEASLVVDKLQNLPEQALALGALANACACVHCGADSYFARSVDTASRINNAGIRSQTLSALAAIRALSGLDAHETLIAAHDSASAARDESLLALSDCAKALIEYFGGGDAASSLATARASVQRLSKIEDRADVLSVIFVTELLIGGDPHDTFAAAPERPVRVEDQTVFAGILCRLAEAQSIAGQDPGKTLTAAHNAVFRLNDFTERVTLLIDLARVERKLGKDPTSLVAAGRRIVDQMQDSAEKANLLIGLADAEADPSVFLTDARRIIEGLVTLTPEIFRASKEDRNDEHTWDAITRIRWHQLNVTNAIRYLRAIAMIEARRNFDPTLTVSSMRSLLGELRGFLYVAAAADIALTERRIGIRLLAVSSG